MTPAESCARGPGPVVSAGFLVERALGGGGPGTTTWSSQHRVKPEGWEGQPSRVSGAGSPSALVCTTEVGGGDSEGAAVGEAPVKSPSPKLLSLVRP